MTSDSDPFADALGHAVTHAIRDAFCAAACSDHDPIPCPDCDAVTKCKPYGQPHPNGQPCPDCLAHSAFAEANAETDY